MADQQAFMNNIATRLGRPTPTAAPAHPYRGAPQFWKDYTLSRDEKTQLFMSNWEKVGGHAIRTANWDEAQQFVVRTAGELNVKRVIRNNQLQLATYDRALEQVEMTVWDSSDPATMRERAANADVGLIVADYAVAVTASIVALSGADKGRSVSLLPTALMALIPVDVIHTRLGEVMRELPETLRTASPAGIHFISGPSRSADIENDLTIGVHGPGVVFAIIVG